MPFFFRLIALLVLTEFAPVSVYGQQFTEVSQSSGIDYTGFSFGATWADFNNDGYPDIYTGNHDLDLLESTTPSL